MKLFKSLNICYNELSNYGKILLFIAILFISVIFFKQLQVNKDGFTTGEKFEFKKGIDSYDEFYADIYDYLVFNNAKNDYEVSSILNVTKPTETSVIADIGCGTGHHVNALAQKGLNITGVDISPYMIKKAKETFPNNKFITGDGLDMHLFTDNSLTHVLSLYFAVYYMDDKLRFFQNCMSWLMPGGYLIIHLVDKNKFDPILPPGNPLYIVSPQKYAKERITSTKITFNDFIYNSKFNLNDDNTATFNEKFKFNNGNIRKQEQHLYMEDVDTIVHLAQEAGFTIHSKINMVKCAYEYQYLYIFTKPN